MDWLEEGRILYESGNSIDEIIKYNKFYLNNINLTEKEAKIVLEKYIKKNSINDYV